MYSKSDTEIMIKDKADEVIEELLELLLSRFQIGLEITMRDSDFIFDYIDSLYHKCLKINLKCSGSYIDSPI